MPTPLPALPIGICFHYCCLNDSQAGSEFGRALFELPYPRQLLSALYIFDNGNNSDGGGDDKGVVLLSSHLQMRKLRSREIVYIAQAYKVNKR